MHPYVDHYAVMGYPIHHSQSPRIHSLFAEQTDQLLRYSAIEVPPERFEEEVQRFFKAGGHGLNCTVPLKERAFQYALVKSERAEAAKAVNTLMVQTDGTLFGDNTDGMGLVRDITINLALSMTGRRILLLGAGGASRGILGPLLECQPHELVIANRTIEKAISLVNEFRNFGMIRGCGFSHIDGAPFDIIFNATAASLHGELPELPLSLLAEGGICYDLAYGKEPTPFVRWGLQQGASLSVDGLGMLVEQAAEAFYLWRGIHPDTSSVIQLLRQSQHS